jgi:hypothetical protein
MSFFHPRPTEEHIYERFEDVATPCPACGKDEVKAYRVLRSTGWHRVERCRACFELLSAEPVDQSYVPLTRGWPTSPAG